MVSVEHFIAACCGYRIQHQSSVFADHLAGIGIQPVRGLGPSALTHHQVCCPSASAQAFPVHLAGIGGSGVGSSALAYYQVALQWTVQLTAPGSAADDVLQTQAGTSISPANFTAAFQGQAVALCNNDCEIGEVYFCMGRDVTGSITGLVQCSQGVQALSSCAECAEISIPEYAEPAPIVTKASASGHP